ncbi:MAG: hypothetical protein J0H55_06675 [Chitinophagaceae bacterium]|nr:hypothetical protein [Chitinophagaceae bacterium]
MLPLRCDNLKCTPLKVDGLNEYIIELTDKKDELISQIQLLNKNYRLLKSDNDALHKLNSKDKNFYLFQQDNQFKENDQILATLNTERNNFNNLKLINAEANAELTFYRKRFGLTDSEKQNLQSEMNKAKDKELSIQLNENQIRLKKLRAQRKILKHKFDTISSYD